MSEGRSGKRRTTKRKKVRAPIQRWRRGTRVAIRQTRAYLDWLDKTLRDAAAQGYDMVEIMQFDMPADYAAMGAMPEEFHRSVAHLYGEIEREVMPMAAPVE